MKKHLMIIPAVLIISLLFISGCAIHQTPDALDIASGVLSAVIM